MAAQSCVWSDIFDDQSRANLERGLIATGTIAFLLGVWLSIALLLTNLRSDLSYRNLAFFTVIASLRRGVSVFSHLPLFNYSESFEDGVQYVSCDISGFWDSFWTVYEVESLTHVCIERYVVVKYTTRGWPIQKNHYVLFQSLCLLFASLYSLPPLFGIGRFGYDFSCQSCVLDMVLPETWDRYISVLIFLLRSVKSTGFMLTMLLWASNLESNYDDSEKSLKDKRFTKSAVVVTFVNLICWLPIAFLRGLVVFSYLFSGSIQTPPSASTVQFAVWTYWVAPAFTTLAMFLIDEKVHQKMLRVWKSDEKKDSVKNE
ncbi:rhodopsin-like [Melitaea cinxia]|uniref:rhodopsin-like n=1 Tax=Melitaea cinxia TaxID=113334 RepID=UPI001E26F244|nr:rhodopsin-like [Melitaea cinxia]